MITWDEIKTTPRENKWQTIANTPREDNWANLRQITSSTLGVGPGGNPETAVLQNKIGSKIGLGLLSSTLSPIEVGVDALIRKTPNKNFLQRFQEATLQGSDIGGALITRGMNPALAVPIGLIGSLAIPGVGELSQLAKTDKYWDVWKTAYKKLDSDDINDMSKAMETLTVISKRFLGDKQFAKRVKSKGYLNTFDYVNSKIPFSIENLAKKGKTETFEIPNLLKKTRKVEPNVFKSISSKFDLKDLPESKQKYEFLSGAKEFYDPKTGEKLGLVTLREQPNEIVIRTIKSYKKGTGKGTELLNEIKKYSKETGKRIVTDEVDDSIIPYWSKQGFTKTGGPFNEMEFNPNLKVTRPE